MSTGNSAQAAPYTRCTMPLLTLANVTCAFGTQVVLDEVTLAIAPGEKIGLIGRNGSGKTTLMRVMLGDLKPDAGNLQFARGARVGYLQQESPRHWNRTQYRRTGLPTPRYRLP